MRKFYSNSLLGLILAIFIVFSFFLPNLTRGKIPIPSDALINLYHPWRDSSYNSYQPGRFPAKNTLITDPILQTYPWRQLAIDNLKSGFMPLWNPYSFAGQPLLANFQSSVFQLSNLFFFLLNFKVAWTINIILPSILTAAFTFLFLSNLEINSKRMSKTSAFFTATILPFSGFFTSWLEWGTIVTTAMWLPLILLSINKIFQSKNRYWAVVLIFALSQTLYSGHFQTAIYVFLVAFIFVGLSFKNSKSRKALSKIIISTVLGILIASPQILPSIEFAKLSARDIDQGYFSGRTDWFIPIKHLIQLIAPDFFGNPTTLNYWGIWNYGEFVSYFGIVPLTLAVFALVNSKKDKFSQFFTILFATSLLLGISNPISKIPYILDFPIISSLQPSRIIFLLVFSGSCLAGIGLDLFMKEKNRMKKILPIAIILAFEIILFALAYNQSNILFRDFSALDASVSQKNLILPLIISLSFLTVIVFQNIFLNKKTVLFLIFLISYFELFRFAYKFTPFTSASLVFPKNEATEFLKSQERPFRIMTTDRRIMHPNASSAYKLESIDGYDPLFLKSYADFISAWQSSEGKVGSGSYNRIITPQKMNFNFMNISNVKYVLSFDTLENENLNKVYQLGETKIYENKNSNPRAYFVKEVIKKNDKEEELAAISSSSFDSSLTATSQDLAISSDITGSNIEISSYLDNQIQLSVETKNQAPLILANVNYPGWKAYVGGKETKIFNANSIFQLIIVPEGKHNLLVKFEPKSFSYGLILMAVGLVGSLAVFVYTWRKKFP